MSRASKHWFLSSLFCLAGCQAFVVDPDDLKDGDDAVNGDGSASEDGASEDGSHDRDGDPSRDGVPVEDGTSSEEDGTPTGDGDGSGDGAGDGDGIDGFPTLPDGRGAVMPFVTYEAEDMRTTGRALGPSFQFTEVASEASQRRAVRLERVGDELSFEARDAANALVVRYSIPDRGQDYWTTLSVFVNGESRGALNLTSRFSWTYGGDDLFNRPEQENPASGVPHHFFDESRALIGDIPAGATVTLRKESSNDAVYYDVDLVDLERAPAPLEQPPGSISVTECGATPDDASDDSAALQACIDRARGERRVLYLPKGLFHSYSHALSVAGVTIRGAGMWHTTVHGYYATFDCWGGNCLYSDFTVSGDTVRRIDDEPGTAFGGNGSSRNVIENVWIEHTKTGVWPGPETRELVVRNVRFRNLFADGVNLYGGTSDSLVENCHARNTGDDAFAAWSHGRHPTNRNNAFRHNHAQLPWRANCFALYGGESTTLSDNVCQDVVQFPGILLARQFDSTAFTGENRLERNSLIRAGGHAYGQGHGALKLHADQGPVQNIWIKELDIVAPMHFGVHVQGTSFVDTVYLEDVLVHAPGEAAFLLNWGSNGALDAVGVSVRDAPNGILDHSDGRFTILRGNGNEGW